MADPLQIILLVLLIIVIGFFLVLGVQVFFLIQDVRKTLTKAHQILDTTHAITDSISEPLSTISGVMGTVGTGAILTKVLKVAVRMIAKSDSKKEDKDE